jgi:hypothetical protein
MGVLKNSLFLLIALFSVACSATDDGFSLSYETEGCFNLSNIAKEKIGEAVFLRANITHKEECGCKSALFKYRAYQSLDAIESELIQGYFTTLSRESLSIPVSAQEKIIYTKSPVRVIFSCVVQ